jgi:hypothetical protein
MGVCECVSVRGLCVQRFSLLYTYTHIRTHTALESDIGRVLQAFSHSDGCTEGVDLKTLQKELIGQYNINTKYQVGVRVCVCVCVCV